MSSNPPKYTRHNIPVREIRMVILVLEKIEKINDSTILKCYEDIIIHYISNSVPEIMVRFRVKEEVANNYIISLHKIHTLITTKNLEGLREELYNIYEIIEMIYPRYALFCSTMNNLFGISE